MKSHYVTWLDVTSTRHVSAGGKVVGAGMEYKTETGGYRTFDRLEELGIKV